MTVQEPEQITSPTDSFGSSCYSKQVNYHGPDVLPFPPSPGTLVQMLLSKQVNYPYPLVITFWGRFSGLLLVLTHFVVYSDSLKRFAQESKRVFFPAARLALLFVGAACTFNYGLQFSTVANAMILSTGCPVYTMLMSK